MTTMRYPEDDTQDTLWLGCRCAGWTEPPTGREFRAAIRAAEPSRRHIAILDAWANQAAAGRAGK